MHGANMKIRHDLGLDWPVSASSNSLPKDLPSRLRPFDDDDDDIYLTAIGLTPGGSITRHIYKRTVHEIHTE